MHGTAQATTAAAAAAASTLNEVADYTTSFNNNQNDYSNSTNNMYIMNDENTNENLINIMPPSRSNRSFSTGSNVDDIKNQLQRYLKKYPEKNGLTTNYSTKTPLRRGTRYWDLHFRKLPCNSVEELESFEGTISRVENQN